MSLGSRRRAGAAARACLLALSLGAAAAGAACGVGARAPLADAVDSPEAVAHAVLAALASRDEAALRRLALSEHEFRTVVWPGLPASRPEMNVPFDYAWGTLAQNSGGHLASVMRTHGGRRYSLVSLEFGGETTRYDGFIVHRDSRLIVRDEEGREQRLALFGSMLERDGRFKVFSYVTD